MKFDTKIWSSFKLLFCRMSFIELKRMMMMMMNANKVLKVKQKEEFDI